jgi:hypothetical protein
MSSADSSVSAAMPRRWEAYLLVFAALVTAYALFGLSLSNAPFQDLPNHLARSHIIGDLLFNQGNLFGSQFALDLQLTPYLVGDLILAALDRLVGMEWSSRIWITTSLLMLPWSAWFLLGVQGCSRRARVMGGLLSLYIATSWFFVSGFLNYEISIACVLFAYGWFLRAQASGSPRAYLCYVAVLVAGYAMHLSALIFITAAVGSTLGLAVLGRRQTLGRAIVLLLPALVLLALHFGLTNDHAAGTFATSWGTPASKLRRALSSVVRFDAKWELPLFGVFLLAALGAFLGGGLKQNLRSSGEYLLLALMFAALYVVLPLEHGGIYDVDNRALSPALLFLLFAGVRAFDTTTAGRNWQPALAIAVAGLNLLYLGVEVLPQNRDLTAYKNIAHEVPSSARVLPVNTRPAMGRYEAFPHAGAFITAESGALTPYLFSAPSQPNIGYFRYLHRLQAPSLFWYTRNDDVVNWEKVRQTYDYLLVTRPYEASRIQLPVEVVRSNDVAVLLRIRK